MSADVHAAPAMISARDAAEMIWGSLKPIGATDVTLLESRGRVLAEEIIASENIPSFDNAAMDGFAVRAADVAAVPAVLGVAGEIAAGSAPGGPLAPKQSARIMTGGPVPAGCDAVVQQEWTEVRAPGAVTVLRSVPAGHNIRHAGSDIAQGTTSLRLGTVLRPQEIGILASLGKHSVRVSRRPAAAVLTTGNELSESAGPLAPGMIRDSNGPMVAALLEEEGCTVRPLGIARDDRSILLEKVREGLDVDLLITSGGVSVGAYDLVGGVLRELGVEIRFWKVNIRPGMPVLFGTKGRTAVFGLPGNPVSTMVTFLKFVRPAIRRLQGCSTAGGAVRLSAVLEHEIVKQDAKRHFVRGVLSDRDGALRVRSTGSQLSNILSSLSLADCLIVLPEEVRTLGAGARVDVELL